jgi:hypothetical protein
MSSLVLFKAFACLGVIFWLPWISLAERSRSSFALAGDADEGCQWEV